MAEGVYKVTEQFEEELCKYTCAPFAVAVDCCSHAIFLSLMWLGVKGKTITIPSHTYVSVPCEIIHAGGRVEFVPGKSGVGTLRGAYKLHPTRVWDSALRFTYNMYIPNSLMCLSFTGPYKHLKLGKGGAVLTDDLEAYRWLKRARSSGRRETSYFSDHFDMIGWNMYMMPDVAARALLIMKQFYDEKGAPKQLEDVELSYPNLSEFSVFNR